MCIIVLRGRSRPFKFREFEARFVMQIFRFYCPASWSLDLMLGMYCMEALSQVTRKELTGNDPFRQ